MNEVFLSIANHADIGITGLLLAGIVFYTIVKKSSLSKVNTGGSFAILIITLLSSVVIALISLLAWYLVKTHEPVSIERQKFHLERMTNASDNLTSHLANLRYKRSIQNYRDYIAREALRLNPTPLNHDFSFIQFPMHNFLHLKFISESEREEYLSKDYNDWLTLLERRSEQLRAQKMSLKTVSGAFKYVDEFEKLYTEHEVKTKNQIAVLHKKIRFLYKKLSK